MFTCIRRFLAPPIFEDEDKMRTAGLLNTILLAVLALTVVIGISTLIVHTNPVPMLVFVGVAVPLWLGALFLMRRGRVRLASMFLSSTVWVIVTLVAIASGGVRTSAFSTYMSVTLIAGLLLGARAGFGFAGLSTLAGLGMLYAETGGALPPPLIPNTSVSVWVSLTVNFILVAVILHQATSNINNALERARRNERALAEANERLQREITERKRAEEVLRESESRYRGLFENVPISLWEEDFSAVKAYVDELRAKGIADLRAYFENQPKAIAHCVTLAKILDVNKATLELYRAKSKKELLGNLDRVLGPEAYDVFKEELLALAEGESPFSTEVINSTLTGDKIHVNLSLSVAPGEEDTWSRVLVSITDITERKRIEEALRENEARYRAVIESQVDLISRYLPDTTLTFVNDAYCQFFGKTREELIGHSYMFMIAPEFRELVRKETEELAKAPRPLAGEYVNYRHDGKERWIQWVVQCISDENGRVVELQAVGRDITERKQAEAQLERNLRETRVRYEVSQALAGAETEDEVLDVLIQHAGLYPQAHTTIFTFDRTGGELAVILRRDNPSESDVATLVPIGTRIPASRYPVLDFFFTDQPFVSDDVFADERVDPTSREITRQSGATSLAAFQLAVGNERMGYIIVLAKPAGYFDEEKQHLYQTLAEQGAVALRAARLRETIRESQQRLSLLVQQSPLAVIEWNTEFQVVAWNPAAEQIFGYTREEALGRHATSLIELEEAQPQAVRVWQAVLAQEGSAHTTCDNVTKDGRRIICEWFNAPLVGVDGQVIGVASLVQDITERKQAEEALHESEERYRLLAEAAHDMIFIINREGNVDYVNSFASQQSERLPEEIIGRPHTEQFPSGDAEHQQVSLRQVLEAGQPRYVENLTQFPSRRMWLGTWLVPIKDEAGQVKSILGVSRDITERKQAEEEIQRLNAELEQRVVERTEQLETANKELEAFSYSVSHDLRAPLRHIAGFVQLLLEREAGRLDATSSRYLDIIAQSSHKMDRLIEDLLALSRAGRAEVQIRHVEMDELVREAQQELAPEMEGRQIVWEISPLPAVEGDPTLLRQVWVNLLSNAIKFTAPRAEARIEISVKRGDTDDASKEGEAIIFVRDNGVGFDPQYAHRLFGVFQRLHREEEFEGTGIGLAIVRRIIHRHGGEVWAEGEIDHGATFYFTLREAKGE